MTEQNIPTRHHRGANLFYIGMVGLAFFALALIFVFHPRPTYSELEKRDLATAPEIGGLIENPSQFTADVSHWFSDSQPFRDHFMAMSMGIRSSMRYYPFSEEEDAVSFKPTLEEGIAGNQPIPDGPPQPQGNPLAEENAKIATSGIFVVGKEPNVRALSAFGGSPKTAGAFLATMKTFADELPGVQVYAMPIPTAVEFYLPEKAAGKSKSQKEFLDHVRDHLDRRVRFVDVHSYLSGHVGEDIYLRTDHHWAPLGAYYGSQALAAAAGVPFRGLDSYDRKTIHRFVGSMYGYSKDIAVRNSPEDFVYHTPNGVEYETHYTTYALDQDYHIISERGPYKGKLFHQFKDGSSLAYNTFMCGDTHLVRIKTGTPGNRRLLIVKDSYGNALPGYLLYSFNEVHVVDFRYFTRNLKQYVKDNGITDLVLAFNVFNACSSSALNKAKGLLNRTPGIHRVETRQEEPASAVENVNEPAETAPAPASAPEEAEPASAVPTQTPEEA